MAFRVRKKVAWGQAVNWIRAHFSIAHAVHLAAAVCLVYVYLFEGPELTTFP